MTTTLKEIAEAAGVSYQTVWRALHGRGRIADKTKQQIIDIANSMNYRANKMAAGLRTNRSFTVGLMVIDISSHYTGRLAREIEKRLQAAGYFVMLSNTEERVENETRILQLLMERRIDGLIIIPSHETNEYLNELIDQGLPIVALGQPIVGRDNVTITSDNRGAGAQALRYLRERNHTRIGAIFGPLSSTPFQDRLDGFISEAKESGIKIEDRWIHADINNLQTGYNAIKTLWNDVDRPTAIFCSSYWLTEGALQAMLALNVRRGIDLELLGLDLNYACFLNPPLIVLRQQVGLLAENAVKTLIAMLDGKQIDALAQPQMILEFPPTVNEATSQA